MNKALKDVAGELLIVSQFTLYADCSDGNRPSFIKAAKHDEANELYKYFCQRCEENGFKVERGQIVNGVFTPDFSQNVATGGSFIEMLPYTISGYVVYRITAQTAGSPITRVGHVALTVEASEDGTTNVY